MSEIWMDVDIAITIPVNKVPLVALSDGYTIDETIAYNESGMDLNWNFVTTAGVMTQTNVVPTTAGDYDWTHIGNGMYKIEMTASGGVSANNATEGFGWFSGKADAILPFSGPVIGFRAAALNNALIDGGDLIDVNVTHVADTAQTGNDNGADINAILTDTGTTLDTLIKDIPTNTEFNARSLLSADYVVTTDTIAEVTAVSNDVGITQAGADKVWGTAARVLTANTNLNDPTAVAIRTEIDSNSTQLAAILSKLLKYVQLLARSDAAIETDNATELTAINADGGTGIGNFSSQTDAGEAIRDQGDSAWITATGFNIVVPDAAGVAATPAEVATALSNINLDHLCKIATAGADMTAEVVDNSIFSRILANGDTSAFDPTSDGLQLIRDRGDAAWTTGAGGSDRLLMVDTTIATLASQTSFTLTAGSADDNAYNNCTIVIEDASTATQKAVGIISDYTGGTKTVTLKYDPAIFTMVATDKVYILAENALKSTLANRQLNVAADGDIAGNIDGTISALSAQAKLDVNAECDTALSDYGANTTTPPTVIQIRTEMDSNSTKMAPSQTLNDYKATGFSTHDAAAVKTAIEAAGSHLTLIKEKTDVLPSGIAKNVALLNLDIYMLLEDGITAATGKTVTGQIRKDAGAFTGLTNAITEVSSGLYTMADGITQAEMNADKVTLKFTADDCRDTIMIIYPT